MTPEDRLVTTSPDEDAANAMEKLIQKDVRQLPVVRGSDQFLGLLRRRDIMRWLQLNSEEERAV
jgi:CBS domain-containing protein